MSKALVFAAYGGPETQELVERPHRRLGLESSRSK